MKNLKIKNYLLVIIILLITSPIFACTAIQVKTKSGAVICARTMEFAEDLKSNIIVIPRGKKYIGTTLNGKDGAKWKAKYAILCINAFNLPHVVDGFNEKGLAVELLYFPGYAQYEEIKLKDKGKALAPWEYGTWILGNFSTVDEVKKAYKDVKVLDIILPQFGFTPPVHYCIRDAQGKSIVIEHIKGKVKIYENPIGVFTNAPPFDWQMANLRNYVNLSPNNTRTLKMKDCKINQIGQGSGMLGIPGDFTPPSRFIRATLLSQFAYTVNTAQEGVNVAINIINNINIAKGTVRNKTVQGTHIESTQWVTIYDLKNKHLYFRTYDNHDIRFIDLKKFNLNAKKILSIPMNSKPHYKDISNTAK